jgi:mRNA interferase RelE/StbE
MSPWQIRWTHQAFRDLERLDPPIARRIVHKLEAAAARPMKSFVRLVGSDDYKLRIGDYRLLALLSHASQTTIVERVDHRSRIYKRER